MFLSLKEELQGINDMIGNYPSPITWCDEQFNYLLGKRSELKKRIGELYEYPEIKMWEGGNINSNGQIAGTISLRKIRNDSGEIKRMFVRPKFRGKKLGNLMIEEVIEIAKENGYSKLYLDTAQYMSSAVTLYKKFGFEETEPYPECIVPKEFWEKLIFMKKEL